MQPEESMNHIGQQHQISIPIASHTPSPPPRPMNLPCADLLTGSREDYNEICVPLYDASITCDWDAARTILKERPELVRYSITRNYETALHIAISNKNTKRVKMFVENIVSLMKEEDLELENGNCETSFALAAKAGNVKIAEIMLNKNKSLPDIPGSLEMMPLYLAAFYGKLEMVRYLYDNSHKMIGGRWTHESRGCVLMKCVEADLFDVALQIVNDHPEHAISGSVLGVLARKPRVFRKEPYRFLLPIPISGDVIFGGGDETQALQLLRIIWKHIMSRPMDEIDDIIKGPADPNNEDEKPTTSKGTNLRYSSRVLFAAAKMGNTAFVVEIIRGYPDLVREVNDDNQSIFHVAVSYREAGIFKLLFDIGAIKDSIITLEDKNGNNMLHLVGILGESAKDNLHQVVPGIVLQMRQEILWFQKVAALLPPSFQEKKNAAGLTPREVFTENHKDLVSKGEEWMKETSAQLMVVAALVATVSFAAGITFAGGYNQGTTNPVLIGQREFTYFVVLNAISFLSSSASILFLLSIHMSRYAEHHFLQSIPRNLNLSLATLFISIVSLTYAFEANLLTLYKNKSQTMPNFIGMIFLMWCLLFLSKLYLPFLFMFQSRFDRNRYVFSKGIRLYSNDPWFHFKMYF